MFLFWHTGIWQCLMLAKVWRLRILPLIPPKMTRVWFWVSNYHELSIEISWVYSTSKWFSHLPLGYISDYYSLWPTVFLWIFTSSHQFHPLEVVLAAMSLGIARRCVEEMNRHEGVESLHPRNLTWIPTISIFKGSYLFQTIILGPSMLVFEGVGVPHLALQVLK